MPQLPESVTNALEECAGPYVFATVSQDSKPNSIYVAWCWAEGADTLVICDNYFSKSRENILKGSRGAILFLTPAGESFQVKGSLEYLTEGPIFQRMLGIVADEHPRVAAVALKVEEAYSGSDRLA